MSTIVIHRHLNNVLIAGNAEYFVVVFVCLFVCCFFMYILLADLRGYEEHTPLPLRVQILSISCHFWEILVKPYIGTLRGVGGPSSGNPGSPSLLGILDPTLV